MRQEDYNEMMRYPWEPKPKPYQRLWQQCPKCNKNYAGDGMVLCTECQHIDEQEKHNRTAAGENNEL
jgi:hypothetical protein